MNISLLIMYYMGHPFFHFNSQFAYFVFISEKSKYKNFIGVHFFNLL